MNFTDLFDEIKDDLARVEDRILSHLNTEIPLLNELGEYVLSSGGKRLRPAILIYTAKMFAAPEESTYTAASALEFLHTATLLHDDVVDEADTRRSKQAARKRWGNSASVLVGDYLLATAFRSLTLLGNHQVLDTISHTTSLMAKGEILQLIRRYDSATEEDYRLYNTEDQLVGYYYWTAIWSYVYDPQMKKVGQAQCLAYQGVCAAGIAGYLLGLL